MKNLLLAGALALAFSAAPAHATLQLSIAANGSVFTCSDGELSCDVSGGANNLLTVDTTVGGFFVQLTLAQAVFGKVNELELSSSDIENLSGAPGTLILLASATGFDAPASFISNSGSLTFNRNLGAGDSTLKFWADPANTQGADPFNTPGALLLTASGHAATDPDSFEGTVTKTFDAAAPFSMTEGAGLALIAGGSVTGFNQSMQSGVPEPQTWAMLAIGFGVLALLGVRRRNARSAALCL